MCVQAGGRDKRMEGVATAYIVPLDSPNIVSNNYLIKCISTCLTGAGFEAFAYVFIWPRPFHRAPPLPVSSTHKDRLASRAIA